ncbi:hypothetical protein [Dyadobacter sp. CY312]|uniref:hypothetical protein n=1 Tax=Dyadobacter sp. CY312 TaxID=2907303 RepID=UPI001F16DAF0|nr:hypothetical protein [Dyadobacter sp. CY312]MCE7039256.1 hypothetical protein [Dyadobacter sp. CY312]
MRTDMEFKSKFWIVVTVCAATLLISGKSRYDRTKQVFIQNQQANVSVINNLKNEVNILQHETIELKDSLAVVVDSSEQNKDTIYVKVVGDNEVLVNLNGQDIRTLGKEIAKALTSDTTRKVNVQVINPKRKGLFK